jgi:Ca2+-transporting ATPase
MSGPADATADSARGLSSEVARARLAEHGPNAVPEQPGRSLAWRLLRQFHDPLIYLLLFALLADLVVWGYHGAEGVPIESVAIGLILFLNATLGLLQEGRAEQALARLKDMAAPRSWVLRDGALVHVPSRELVPGDVVRVEAGDRIPADATLLDGGARVDEALLTGESVPIDKEPGSELLAGTLLVRGRARLEVVRTGVHSAMGKLAALLNRIEAGESPLERRLNEFGHLVVRYVIALAALIAIAGVAIEGVSQIGRVFLFACALAVAAVPEGLPAVLAVALSLGVERMAKRKAVVRRLAAVEALGSVTVIATDKTGTLTENRMVVARLEGPESPRALRAMILACDLDPESGAGDPLELALVEHARAQGLDPVEVTAQAPRRSSTPFDSVQKFMRVTVDEDGQPVSYLKGAPEVVLAHCELDDAERDAWREKARAAAAQGHKVLALAWGAGETESGLTWSGLVLLRDPPRPEVAKALADCASASIRVLMITGDHPATAEAIAREIGLPEGRVVTGDELEGASKELLGELVREATVFARTTPEHKLSLVEALQAQGEIVAMTGDGVNDAPALKRADVGVVMGERGSDVAREAGDVILLDDDFATIVAAVEEGRSVYTNIQKFIRLLFSTNLSELLVVILGTAGAVYLALQNAEGSQLLPITASMILWINLITDSLPALATGLDVNPGVMSRPPRDPKSPLLDRPSLTFVIAVGAILALVPGLLLILLPELGGVSREVARTMAFHVLVCGQLLSTYHARRVAGPSPPNRAFHAAVGLSLVAQILMGTLPPLQAFLGMEPLTLNQWGLVAASVAAGLLVVEVLTRFLRPPRLSPPGCRAG